MWIFIRDTGFFSIVQNDRCQPGELVIRARCRGDLDKLQEKLLADYGFAGKVIDTPKADYNCRMFAARSIVAQAIAQAVTDITYDNFKNTIPSAETARHDAYFNVWSAMNQWQQQQRRSGGKH